MDRTAAWGTAIASRTSRRGGAGASGPARHGTIVGHREAEMLELAVLCLIVAAIAGVFGVRRTASGFTGVARLSMTLSVIFAVVSALL